MKSVWIATALVSATLWQGCASTPVTCELPRPRVTNLPERGVSAHRGGQLGCPVNTVGAFRRAICRGVHQIELDVRATADAALVIAHDDHVTGEQGEALRISESTLAEVQSLRLEPCTGEVGGQRIPTLEEALAVMPQNLWINVDIKESDPLLGRLVAETVAKAHRFKQIIFGNRDDADLAVYRVAEEVGAESWISNMNRHLFRFRYVDNTIASCDEFIQLVSLLGRPSRETIDRLKQAGVRVNYSWLREEDQSELREKLESLFDSGVDFVLVDHAGPAMEAACALGIPPVVPRWSGPPPFTCPGPPSCAPDLSLHQFVQPR